MGRRRSIAVGIALLVLAGIGGYYVSHALRVRDATRDRREADARHYAESTGVSLAASRQIVLLTERRLADVASADELRSLLLSFQGFEGTDRRKVAQYCVGFLVAPGLDTGDPARLETVQLALKVILGEYSQDDLVAGVAFGLAGAIGLRDDPFVQALASEALVSPNVSESVKRFIAGAMFAERPSGDTGGQG